jgi:hypothetical protein
MTKRKYQSVPFKITLKIDGALLVLPYTVADSLLSDETKGKITITVQKASDGTIKNDANGTPIDHITMYANGIVYSQAVLTLGYGFADAEELIYTIWYHKKIAGVVTIRDLFVGSLTIEAGTQATAPS